jgi:hypothetical protein
MTLNKERDDERKQESKMYGLRERTGENRM